jgi:hypothetical protein
VAGDVEEKLGIGGKGKELLFIRGFAIDEKGGVVAEVELGQDRIPVGEVGAVGESAGPALGVDAF